jgi:hypothetical protein
MTTVPVVLLESSLPRPPVRPNFAAATPGTHFIQQDSPDEIGTTVAEFVRKCRSSQTGLSGSGSHKWR